MAIRTHHRARLSLLTVAALGTLLISACSSGSSGSPGASGSAAPGLTTVKFATGWVTPDFEDIPVFAAQQNGYYKEAGLDVKISYPPTTTTTPKLLATGTANLGYVQTSDLLSAVKQNVPIQAVAGVWQRPSNALVAKPGATIDPKTFKGKTFAVFAGTENIASLNLFLKSAGLTKADVKVVTAASDNLTLVLAGKVDYALNASPYAAAEIQSSTGKAPSLLLASNLPVKSDYAQTAYAGDTSWMSSHPEIVRKWLAATQKGAQWAIDNPDQAVALFVKNGGKDAGDSVYNTAGWKGAIPLIKGNGPLFAMDDAQWNSLITFLRDGGAITGDAPAMNKLYTNDYLATS